MSFEADAISSFPIANMAKDKINLTKLKEIENNLDRQEKISIMFLTTPTKIVLHSYDLISNLLKNHENCVLSQWFLLEFNKTNWEEKLLESLLLVQNLQIIRYFGFTEYEEELFRKQFLINEKEVSPNLNRVLKSLYLLCEDLCDEEMKKVVNQFGGTDIQQEEFELYLLYWIQTNRISISELSGNLKSLLEHLKAIQFDIDSAPYISLENWNEKERNNEVLIIPRNMQDNLQSLDNSLPMDGCFTETQFHIDVKHEDSIYDFEKGLCYIINEEQFDKWSNRQGSQKDVQKLKETFEKFGFDIVIKENLTKQEIFDNLKSVSNYTKQDYDCVILCIMSHGEKGTIVTRDEKLVSLDNIKDLICTTQLKRVVKIIIVQACQGQFLGHDTTDGSMSEESFVDGDNPVKGKNKMLKDNIKFADLVMFVATIPDFKSIRNTVQGSWFIQKLCEVLEAEDRITWKKLSLKVKNLVSNERGEICDNGKRYSDIVQIPEIVEDRLTKDFIFRKVNSKIKHLS
ncbi:caspase-3-like [Leptopilina heterotoma]|uniref:caspase-3-like n=1 Tax=Leptopilina heterotoma TaxID=63436 RepID=UPI001CA9352F|nr:caspase-3-like [Leptopilina heterotoma]